MDYGEKLDFCEELFADEFDIGLDKAGIIISFLNLDEMLFERYEEELKEEAEKREAEEEQNYREWQDHYNSIRNIHGGVDKR